MKYVFECSVKEIVRENSATILYLIPDANFSVTRKEGGSEPKSFAVFQPVDDNERGLVFKYQEFVKIEVGNVAFLCSIGKLRLEFTDDLNDGGKMNSIKFTDLKDGTGEMALIKVVHTR